MKVALHWSLGLKTSLFQKTTQLCVVIVTQGFFFQCVKQSWGRSCDRWPLVMKHNVHFHYRTAYATSSPLTLHVSHVGVEVSGALNYVQAPAVDWCHEPGYHRKSETGGSWPFVFMNKMFRAGRIPKASLISWDTNTTGTTKEKNKRFSRELDCFLFTVFNVQFYQKNKQILIMIVGNAAQIK